MNRQNLGILLLFICSLVLWRWFDPSQDELDGHTRAIFQPNFTARQLTTLHYDQQGQLKQRLQAKYAEHYDQLEMTELEQPVITVNDAQGRPDWRITGQKGVLNKDDNAILREQVKIDNLQPDSAVTQIRTDYLEMDLGSQQVRTNLKVEMEGPGFHNQGVGFKGQLKQKIYQLLGNSHAVYFNPPH